MSLYDHTPHPRIEERKETGPAKVADQHRGGANGRIALRLTALVGTMWAAYTFALLAIFALPSVLGLDWFPSRTQLIVAWLSQTFIQLVMLAVLQLGQNIQAAGADARAEQTFRDAEAILSEALQIHEHLEQQDAKLILLEGKLGSLLLRSWPEKRTQ